LKLYNRLNKKLVKFALRDVREAKTYEDAAEKFQKATKILDKVTARGVMHRNTAANQKSALAKFVNSKKQA